MVVQSRIEMFGGLRVIQGDRVIQKFQTQKTGALLAYLAIHAPRTFSREIIAGLLWPDGDPAAIRNRLNQAVSSLRRQLHPPGSNPNGIIVADHQMVSVNSTALTSDVHDFRQLLRNAATLHHHQQDRAMELRREAVDMYRGELLEGYVEEWAQLERIRFSDQYMDALTQLVRYYAAQEDLDQAIEMSVRRLAQDPANEKSHRTLMRLYLKAGRGMSAGAQYLELERCLQALGKTPSAAATALYEQAKTVSDSPVSQSMPAITANPKAYLPGSAAVVAPSRTSFTQLPIYLAKFVGREEEQNLILDCIRSKQARILGLRGLGGVGKTRLAVEVCETLRETDDFSIEFLSAREIQPLTTEAIARKLLVTYSDVDRSPENLLATFAQRGNTILVLDDVEMMDQICTDTIRTLIHELPDLIIILTGCINVNMEGEWGLLVKPLPLPDATDFFDLKLLAESPSIALLVARAQLVKPDFQFTDRSSEAILELAQLLEGYPLAIELAASWARSMTPAQLTEKFKEDYNAFALKKVTGHHHDSLQLAIARSYNPLNDEQKTVLKRLTAFEGGFNVMGAEFTCPESDVASILDHLLDVGLLHSTLNLSVARFAMLKTVRAFVRRQMTDEELADAARRHAQFLYDRSVLIDQADAIIKLQGLVDESVNLELALMWFLKHESAERALHFAAMLGRYGEFVDTIAGATRWLEMAIAAYDLETARLDDLAMAKIRLSRLLKRLLHTDRAKSILDEVEVWLPDLQRPRVKLEFFLAKSQCLHFEGEYEKEEALIQSLMETWPETVGDYLYRRTLLQLGHCQTEQRKYAEADQTYQLCARYSQDNADDHTYGMARGSLAHLRRVEGKLRVAEEFARESLRILSEYPGRYAQIDAAITLADVLVGQDRIAEASEILGETLALSPQTKWHLTMIAQLSAGIATHSSRFDSAARLLGYVDQHLIQANPESHTATSFAAIRDACIQVLGRKAFEEEHEIGAHQTFENIRDLAYAILANA